MKIYTEIIGNLQDPEWVKKAREAEIEYIDLDQWTAQKSRFVVKGDRENEYAVALKRHSQMLDGDIIEYLPEQRRIAQADPKSLREYGFAKGSMGPKVEAACRFVEKSGKTAVIGALDKIDEILAGRSGTRVVAEEGVVFA